MIPNRSPIVCGGLAESGGFNTWHHDAAAKTCSLGNMNLITPNRTTTTNPQKVMTAVGMKYAGKPRSTFLTEFSFSEN